MEAKLNIKMDYYFLNKSSEKYLLITTFKKYLMKVLNLPEHKIMKNRELIK